MSLCLEQAISLLLWCQGRLPSLGFRRVKAKNKKTKNNQKKARPRPKQARKSMHKHTSSHANAQLSFKIVDHSGNEAEREKATKRRQESGGTVRLVHPGLVLWNGTAIPQNHIIRKTSNVCCYSRRTLAPRRMFMEGLVLRSRSTI